MVDEVLSSLRSGPTFPPVQIRREKGGEGREGKGREREKGEGGGMGRG